MWGLLALPCALPLRRESPAVNDALPVRDQAVAAGARRIAAIIAYIKLERGSNHRYHWALIDRSECAGRGDHHDLRGARAAEAGVRKVLAVTGAICLLAGGNDPIAQSFPARSVRYIMPLPAGQETDAFARLLAQRLGEGWGRQVVVDNRPGGGTVIGTDVVAKSAADGYTLLHAITAHAINATLFSRLPYDTLKDFSCITHLGNVYVVMVAHPSFPVKTVADLIALARAKPGDILYATGPVGNAGHINTEALRLAAGIKISVVHYKGAGPALFDLVPGRVPLVSTVVVEALPYIRAGKVRAIAVTSPKRSPSLPDVPAVGENLPQYQSGTGFWALVTRSGTPAPASQQINADVLKALQGRELRERMTQMDVEVVGSTPEQCDAFLREQVDRWGGIVRAAGLRAD